MSFFQDAPRLGNQYDDDSLLQGYLARKLPEELRRSLTDTFRELGELSGQYFYAFQLRDRLNEPELTQWDAWGRRVDRIDVTPLWREAEVLTARHGLVAVAYEQKSAELSRIHQFALNYVIQPSLDVYSCPLAMTDGAARTLLSLGNTALIDRALPHLTSRDPAEFWTSGQWMTERTGGSDVGLTQTVARQTPEGWRLYGTKWFTSATTAQMALTLARPEGNGPGGKGLALFYVETRQPDGFLNGILINRLKDKLGTRKVPTAELTLDGALAVPVAGLTDGIRNMSSMLNVTRTWNAVASVWMMRRAMALARDYASRRVQFGAKLSEKPLHVDTLAGMEAEFEGAFLLAFRAAELLGRMEAKVATEQDLQLQRLVTPLAKLTTGKQTVALTSEALESFGGAGYVEDTGLPRMLADAQVLSIWEGTTNVLSLDALRALAKEGTLDVFHEDVEARLAVAKESGLKPCVKAAQDALEHARGWASQTLANPVGLEAGARRFALTLGRTMELALLVEHAQWCVDHGHGPKVLAAARRFARHGVNLITDMDLDDSRLLA
ncbi:acyl-CoA dehydrogenase family protein [Stigmatella aurantiaca]|uniref:Acyl-CoA dehydrogenase n=1 Tax=Stigmatella aurantiaca (strain DW4/3-1) TaxID=378806 RepID=Q08MW2_STIAD|nr:acyl-CoA dehydrogenase family protein [Stigmatella aurantiaca]ADO72226.1 acyl-CoA dehydrogenase [Stigmatella aurantiaca DW4/3-1]EAU61819.1 acyl-CoA dehydrogenase, C-terminal:Acyl-CoA dehydrogenase, central region [Stigmatella aurantiaca DW4/3-1]